MKHKSYFKVVAFSLALAIAMSLWLASPVMLCYAQDGYGGAGGGGGGGGGEPYAGITYLGGKINFDGVITEHVTAGSTCNLGQLMLDKGTTALNKSGNRLLMIIILETEDPPPPPAGFSAVGCICDFRPEGATFEPPLPLTFTYDPALLPEGFDEKNLVIAMWDEATGEWVILDSTVDPDTRTITAQVSHFTVFAILAGIAPAAFTVTDLAIVPSKTVIGGRVTISALVNNAGSLSGSYEVTLKINDAVVATEEVTLPGHASQKVTFTTAKDVAGTYTVDVNGLAGTFTVGEAPAPPEPAPPEPAPPEPTPPAPPPTQLLDWYLIGGIIAGCIVIGGVIWLTVSRRRA